MLRFLVAVRPPHGGHPLLGDAAIDAWPTPGELLAYAERLGIPVEAPHTGWTILADSGLAAWRDERQFLLADVGPIGPPHLAAHGHCDSLSFEWHIGGVPFVVDSGTLTYEPSPERLASRSVRAHNTVEIDGREQHEIWAAFRVARRSQVRAEAQGDTAIHATLVPWYDGQLRIERRFSATSSGIRIEDRITGSGEHAVTSRLHLHPRCAVTRHGSSLHLRHGNASARIEFAADQEFVVLDTARSGSVYCASFGEPVPNQVVQMTANQRLPLQFAFELQSESH
jgi:uncharacterized heparinase superfamily protein